MSDLEKRLRTEQDMGWSGDAVCVSAELANEAADALAAKDARIAELEKALELPTEAYLAQLEDLGGKGTVDPLTADDDELFIFDLVLIQPLIDAIRRARAALGGQHGTPSV
jgi:hypothetical protein